MLGDLTDNISVYFNLQLVTLVIKDVTMDPTSPSIPKLIIDIYKHKKPPKLDDLMEAPISSLIGEQLIP